VQRRSRRPASCAGGAGAVIRLFLFELAGIEDRDHLAGFHLIAFVDVQLLDAPGNLRADHDVIGGDDAREDKGHRARGGPPVVTAAGDDEQQDEGAKDALHVELNNCIKHLFDSSTVRVV
jgi:hypothetical protein